MDAPDIRMRRAAFALLGNPALSLFQALREGGYDYLIDNDLTCEANDTITLQQRKHDLATYLRYLQLQQFNLSQVISPQTIGLGIQQLSSGNNISYLPGTSAHSLGSQQILSGNTLPLAFMGRIPQLDDTGGTSLASSGPHRHSAQRSQQVSAFEPIVRGQGTVDHQSLAANSASTSQVSDLALFLLNDTAQRNNMSLEQLARALSIRNDLANVLIHSDTIDQKKTKALDLYREESKGLHQKCMLLAGYSQDECQAGTKEYADFVKEVWRNEQTRLQELNQQIDKQSELASTVKNILRNNH